MSFAVGMQNVAGSLVALECFVWCSWTLPHPWPPPKKTNDFASSDPHQWDLAVGYRWGGVMETLEAPGDLVGHGGFSKHLGIWLSGIGGAGQGGLWKHLGIWLSGIGGGGGHGTLEHLGIWLSGIGGWGGSWDSGATWGFGCRV